MTRTHQRHVVWVEQADGWRLIARPRSARRARSLVRTHTSRGCAVVVESLRVHPARGIQHRTARLAKGARHG